MNAKAWYRRPEVVVFSIAFFVVGLVIGVLVLPAQWGLHLRILAGLALGFTASLLLFANRIIGGADFD